jgi:hypothetical protein
MRVGSENPDDQHESPYKPGNKAHVPRRSQPYETEWSVENAVAMHYPTYNQESQDRYRCK